MLCQELVDNLREQLVGYKTWIVVVGDDDATDAFRATVGVERVVYNASGWAPLHRRGNSPCSSTSCR